MTQLFSFITFRKSISAFALVSVVFSYCASIDAMILRGEEREPPADFSRATSLPHTEASSERESTEEKRRLSAEAYVPREEFADPTTDTAFKQLLSLGIGLDYSIAVSFLNCFVPAFEKEPIAYLVEYPVAIPVLRKKGEKQTFMDFHVTTQQKEHVVVEMQVKRHVLFDERALFYAAATYCRQLSEDTLSNADWFKGLQVTYAIQILGYDSNRVRGLKEEGAEDTLIKRVKDSPLKDNEYIKHYMMTDQNSGQKIDHLQMIQIELPRVKKDLFPPQHDFTEKDWWLSVFKHAKEYKRELLDTLEMKGISMPIPIQRAFGRLEMSKWEPRLVKEYVADELDLQNYGSVLAAERAEGYTKGKAEGLQEERMRAAQTMIEKDFESSLIAELTNLSLEEIETFRKKGGRE